MDEPDEGSEVLPPRPVEERLAQQVVRLPLRLSPSIARALERIGEMDRRLYGRIATLRTPTLDRPLRVISNAANYSRLWLGIAGALAVAGGRAGRRAALTGVAAIGAASFTVNIPMKRLGSRGRPDREGLAVPLIRRVRMPKSSSFPSGHSASAFAFAIAVGGQLPSLKIPLRAAAATVAYSRVHTGVHYPGDVLVGSLAGVASGLAIGAAARRWSML